MTLGNADGCKGPTLAKDPRKARAEGRGRLEVEIKELSYGYGVQGERKEAEGTKVSGWKPLVGVEDEGQRGHLQGFIGLKASRTIHGDIDQEFNISGLLSTYYARSCAAKTHSPTLKELQSSQGNRAQAVE